MVDTLGTAVSSETKKVTDVIKWEADQTFCREELALQADEGLDIGDVVEDFSSSYGKVETAANAAGVFVSRKDTALSYATADITFAAQPANADTIVVNGRTYTFKTSLTPADDEILLGADVDASMDNFMAAVNGGVGAGTEYDAGTPVENADVTAEIRPGDVIRLRAKVPGTAGNALTLAETGADITISGATLSGGDAVDPAKGVILLRQATVDGTQLNYNGLVAATVNTALKALGIVVIG